MSQRRFFQTTLSRYFFGRLATALRRQASVVILVGVTAVTMGACHGSQPTPEVHDPGVRGRFSRMGSGSSLALSQFPMG